VDGAFPGCRIVVSINDPAAIEREAEAEPYRAAGRLTAVASAHNLLESVLVAADGVEYPLLVTTGDNVLMTSDALREFHAFALREGVDAASMVARKEAVLAAHPEGQPRFWEFRDGAFSGCNTFWLKERASFAAAEIFRGGGQFLKFPKRFIAAFGLTNLIGFRLSLFSIRRMEARLSKRFHRVIRTFVVDHGELAIDVDTEFSHEVAERLLAARRAEERRS
jgi:hypothetical protein